MPEGPEMFRVARQIVAAVGAQPLTEVWFAFEHLRAGQRELTGRRLMAATTLGKALLLHFDNDRVVYTHSQLYGRWLFAEAGRRPDTNRQLRLALTTRARSALLYSASDIELIDAASLRAHPFVARAGLDVLSSGADVAAIAQWMRRDRFAGRQLGHLLLDQSFLAGVGNYLRSEILFAAGLHWTDRPRDLDESAFARLAGAAHTLMWRSVETGGMTNRPERAKALRSAGWAWRDYRHFVFNRDGQVCHACDTPIHRVAVAGRRLYYCPSCQGRVA